MKILIIGKNSYIGNHIDEWLTKYGHEVEQLDVLTEDWKAYDYSPYDAIVHVAGIVHRPDCQDWKLYKSVNTDLPVQIAKLFKASLGSSSSSSSNGSTANASSNSLSSSNGSEFRRFSNISESKGTLETGLSDNQTGGVQVRQSLCSTDSSISGICDGQYSGGVRETREQGVQELPVHCQGLSWRTEKSSDESSRCELHNGRNVQSDVCGLQEAVNSDIQLHQESEGVGYERVEVCVNEQSSGSNGSIEGSNGLSGSNSSNDLNQATAIEQLEQTKSLNSSSAALNNLNGSSAALNQPKVKTFVFFSTMGVYDAGKKLAPSVVDENTPLLNEGNSMYGRSKVLAEIGLSELQDGQFNVAFVRPPSVYGKGCKGGYITGFKKIASMLPIIPRAYENACQSFIYIDNLSECVRLIIEQSSSSNSSSGSNGSKGLNSEALNGSKSIEPIELAKPLIVCPQDDEIPNANRLLEVICKGMGKKYRSSKFLGLCLRMVSFVPLVKKAYGGIEYSRKLSDIPGMDYVVVPFEEGMRRTVN